MIAAIILDVLIVAVIAFFIVLSSKQGFMKTFIGFVGCLAALVMSVVLSWMISDLVYGNIVRPKIISSVEETVGTDGGGGGSISAVIEKATEAMPDYIVEMAETRNLFDGLYGDEGENLTGGTQSVAATVVDTVAKPIVTGIIQSVSMVIFFILGLIAVKFLSRILNGLVSGKILGKVNSFMGGIIGIPKAIVFAVIFTWVVGFYVFTRENGLLGVTIETVEKTYLFEIINSFNPLLK